MRSWSNFSRRHQVKGTWLRLACSQYMVTWPSSNRICLSSNLVTWGMSQGICRSLVRWKYTAAQLARSSELTTIVQLTLMKGFVVMDNGWESGMKVRRYFLLRSNERMSAIKVGESWIQRDSRPVVRCGVKGKKPPQLKLLPCPEINAPILMAADFSSHLSA